MHNLLYGELGKIDNLSMYMYISIKSGGDKQ